MASAKLVRPKDVPTDVRRLQERFVHWRANKEAAAETIPARLWAAAVKLSRAHGVSRVSHWLRLHHTTLQKRAGERANPRCRLSKPNFVEWNLPTGSIVGVSSAEYVVEAPVREGETQRIHVRGASISEVAALARALRVDGSAG